MLGVASAVALTGKPVPVLDTLGTGRTTTAATSLGTASNPGVAVPGSCLTWQRPDASDASATVCSQPHLFELAATVRLDAPASAPFPDQAGWRQLVDGRCTPPVVSYLHGRFDPAGRFRVGALTPTPRGWIAGDRVLRCGLQAPAASGALMATRGHVADADQAEVYAPGTCLGLSTAAVGGPVDCAEPHAAEVTGVADLGKKFSGPPPAVADQDGYLQPTCTKIASDYLGGADKLAASKLTVYWQNLSAASWNAGTHEVTCNLAAQLPGGGGFAPLTGSARTGVRIGTTRPTPAGSSR